jgi:hypothetical protein
LVAALVENYRAWAAADKRKIDAEKVSTTLYDTVAVYLAFASDLCTMETLPIAVTPQGKTVIDQQAGKPMSVATAWKDLKAYEDFLVERLTKN